MKKDFRRAVHFDFHTHPGIEDMNNFDVQKFADILQKSHVSYVNIFAKCNQGYCYYPTKIGMVYPGLTKDLFGEMIKELHARNIGVSAYFNVGIDVANLLNHKEWVKQDNIPNNYSAGKACFNKPGYVAFIKSIIQEVLDNYDVDGVFCDCMYIQPCYCEKCKTEMMEKNIDWTDKKQASIFYDTILESFVKDVCKMVGTNKHMQIKGYKWDREFEDHIELVCLPNSDMTYDYFLPYAAFARSCGKETTYMAGRFVDGWGDFGGIVSKASLENDMYDALCAGFGFCIADHLHPSQGVIPYLYNNIRQINETLMRYEPYIDGAEYLADIAVITQSANEEMCNHSGISRMLSELKFGYNIIRENMDFTKYKVLLLPDNVTINNETAKKIEAFMQNGGKVISCGSGGLNICKTDFALEDYRKVIRYEGLDNQTHSFFVLNSIINSDKTGVSWATYKPSIYMQAKAGEVWAEEIGLYFDKHKEENGFNYVYIPPKNRTGRSSIIVTDNFAHVSFDIFEGYAKHFSEVHREIVKLLLNKYLPSPIIKAENMPISSRITLTKTNTHTNLNIKITHPESKGTQGIVDEHNSLPAGKKILVKGHYTSAKEPLTGKIIAIQPCGQYSEIILPEIVGFIMIVLQ